MTLEDVEAAQPCATCGSRYALGETHVGSCRFCATPLVPPRETKWYLTTSLVAIYEEDDDLLESLGWKRIGQAPHRDRGLEAEARNPRGTAP
jgi:hypothetical protein